MVDVGDTAALDRVLPASLPARPKSAEKEEWWTGQETTSTTQQKDPPARVLEAPSHYKRTSAILDRLMHRAVVFNIKGPSWRMREHQALAEAVKA